MSRVQGVKGRAPGFGVKTRRAEPPPMAVAPSHIAVTPVSMLAATLVISNAWLSSGTRTAAQPAQDARLVAGSVAGTVMREEEVSSDSQTSIKLSAGRMPIADGGHSALSGVPSGAPNGVRSRVPLDSA